MLSLSLVAARSRLLRGPATSRCISLTARSIFNNVAVVSTPSNLFQASKSRMLSTSDGSKDENEDQDTKLTLEDEEAQSDDGESSPLERLMQHSQQFRLDMDMDDDDKSEDCETAADDDDDDDLFASSWQSESNTKIKTKSRNAAAFKRNTFRRRGSSDRHSELGQLAVDHLLEKDMDEINYDAELENVWSEEELKQRKFHQALRREQDRDHVCTNCGERGHRARNCLLPRICSNCGNLGHVARQCRYRKNPDSIDEFLLREEDIQQQKKKNRKIKKKAAKVVKNPGLPLPKDVPTSDFNKRNESLRKELEAELDEYADMLEEQAQKRRARKEQNEQKED